MAVISEIEGDKVTVIIDGNSVAYRAYFKAPPLTAGGIQTGVIHVFLSVLDKLSKNDAIGKIVAVFDAKGKNHRHELLQAYKATREAMPEELSAQIEVLKEIIPLTGVPLYSVSGYEADDVIYTLAEKTIGEVWLVTKDKDLHQLVGDKVKIYDYQTDNIIDREKVLEKFGLYPEKILDMLSLAGDSSDNIPGVAGVGMKTAHSLLEKYGDMEGVYNNISEIKGKLQEKLIIGKENAYLSRQLASLVHLDELPDAPALRNVDRLKEIYEKYRLKSHLNKLSSEVSDDIKTGDELEDFSATGFSETVVLLEEGAVAVPELIAFIENQVYAAGGGNYEICGNRKTAPFYFDLKNLLKGGFIGEEKSFDIMLGGWLADPDSGGFKKTKNEDIIDFLSGIYAQREAVAKRLQELELEELYYKIELPVAYILAHAEMVGILIDETKLRETANSLKIAVNSMLASINNKANFALNPNSPKQLGSYLYDVLGIKPLKKNKQGYSTDEETLLELRELYPDHRDFIDDILKYRELNKILSTYTLNLLDFRGADGRIRTDFKQSGTATGRLSSANPNLQNIPQRSGVAQDIRSAFIAGVGKTFVAIDYSQIELRILAHMSGDENLVASFMDNIDIHSMTARSIFHLDEDSVISSELRRIAKAVNFGILYGLSAFGLARDTKVTAGEAKIFIDRYFELYPGVGSFISKIIEETKQKGYCHTILGRKRFIKDINSRNGNIRQRAERMAVNAPIQGSAADIIKLAMIGCHDYIKQSGVNAQLILQIHDELLFEVADGEVENFSLEAKKIMESVFKLNVPLLVNCKTGKNWGDL